MTTKSIILSITYEEGKFSTSPEYWDWSYLISLPNTTLTVDQVRLKPAEDQELNARTIFELMYGEGDGLKPESVHVRDHPIDRVKVVPFNLGKILSTLDPESQFFHIEFFPQRNVAEIWSRRAWNDSLTRRLRLVKTDDSLVAQRNSLHSEIRFFIARKSRCGSERADKLAELIISFDSTHDYLLQVLDAPVELIAALDKYRKNGLQKPGGSTSGSEDVSEPTPDGSATGSADQG